MDPSIPPANAAPAAPTAAQRIGLIAAICLALPFLLIYKNSAHTLGDIWLRPFPNLTVAMPNLADILGQSVWLGVECLPLLVWRSWRDVGSLRLPWSWTVLVPALAVALNLIKFSGWPPGPHPCARTLDILCHTLLVAANEEIIFRGYTFHNRPQFTPRLTVLASAVTFAAIHYINLEHAALGGVNTQVGAALIIGLGLGVVRLTTGSLGWCILIHWLVDAASDLGHDYGANRLLLAAIILPVWLVSTLLVFSAHPALRPASAAPPPPDPAPGRREPLRRVAVGLLGLVAGAALLLAVVLPFTRWVDPALRGLSAAIPIGFIGLPAGMLAVTTARWRRWRSRVADPAVAPSEPPPASLPPILQAVKAGSLVLFGVTLLVGLDVAILVSSASFSFSTDPSLGFWGTVWSGRGPLGCLTLSVLSPPLLGVFSLWRVLHPRVSRTTTAGWILGAGFYGFLTWLALVHVNWDYQWFFVLKVSLWHLAVMGLVTALFLAGLNLPKARRLA